MFSDIIKDVSEILDALVVLFMLISSVAGIMATLYLQIKTKEAGLSDFVHALKEVEDDIRDAVKSGLITDMKEAVAASEDLLQKMHHGRKLPKYLAERARSRIRRVVRPLLPPPEKT